MIPLSWYLALSAVLFTIGVIGEKLRAARQQQGISLRESAQRADVSASMLSQVENGRAYPSVRSMYNIAAALSVPVDVFFPKDRRPGFAQGRWPPITA